jgi:hypothetical protein
METSPIGRLVLVAVLAMMVTAGREKAVPNASGVYVISDQDEVVYVGTQTDVYPTISDLRQRCAGGKPAKHDDASRGVRWSALLGVIWSRSNPSTTNRSIGAESPSFPGTVPLQRRPMGLSVASRALLHGGWYRCCQAVSS